MNCILDQAPFFIHSGSALLSTLVKCAFYSPILTRTDPPAKGILNPRTMKIVQIAGGRVHMVHENYSMTILPIRHS